MSTFKVPVTSILAIHPHTNAERLELATVYGFQVIVPKGRYKVGDVVVYVPIDSIINNQKLMDKIFPPDSKVKLHKNRVRQIRLRGLASQGMIVDPTDVYDSIAEYAKANGKKKIDIELEQDLSEILNIIKYEPEVHDNTPRAATPRNKPRENPLLHKYGGLENLKWFPNLFAEGEEVSIQEKLHGTNARYALLPNKPNTFWKKILNFFGLMPKIEFAYGSNNVQLQDKKFSGYYEENVYFKMAQKYDIEKKLKLGETVFGEIVGPGIQANYHYDVPQGHHKFVLFDVKFYDGTESRFLTPSEMYAFAKDRGFDVVPELYRGPFNLEKAKELTKGNSVYAPGQKVREGVAIKAMQGLQDSGSISKKMLKLISEDYLSDASNTDTH